jgi:phytoene desaturase
LERKWGVFFPKGGTAALVQALAKVFTELGGELRLDAEIDRIETHGGSVCAVVQRSGERTECDLVASNADVVHTYGRLLRDETAAQTMRKRLSRSAYSMSLVLIYFGTRRRYPNLLHHNIIFGPRYRELLREIFSGGRLADDFSLYLHAPTRSDADLAPPGCDAFYVLSPVPHLGKAAIDWRSQGPIYAEKIFSYLERRYMPDLRREIVTQRIFTPADFKKRAQLSSGLRLLARAAADAKRLFSGAQSRSEHSRSLFRRRRDPPGRRYSRSGQFGEGDRCHHSR